MFNKKIILLTIIILIISVISIGCSSTVKDTETVDKNVKIATNDSNIVIENSDMSVVAGENLEWPADKMDPLPKPDAEVTAVTESDGENVTIVHIKFNQPGLERDYIQKVKDLGFIESYMQDRDGTLEFEGSNEDAEVTINYLEMGQVGYISLKRK